MNILVTGNLGYVGSVVTADLQQHGHHVTGYDIGYFAPCTSAAAPPADRQRIGDTRAFDPAELAGIDAVVHLAALSNDPLGELDASLTDDINVGGLRCVAGAAKAAGIRRFVFASSCSLYGTSGGDRALDETCAHHPLTAYARSKVDGERTIFDLADERFRPIALRFSTAYGWSPRLRLDLVVNNLVASALVNGVVALESDGTPWRPLVHVRDMAQAIRLALESDVDRTGTTAYNVGSESENYQIRTIASHVARAGGDLEITLKPAGESGDRRSYNVGFDRIRAAFPAFRPAFTLDDGIAELFANLRGSIDAAAFASPRYVRIRRIRELIAAGEIDQRLRTLAVAS